MTGNTLVIHKHRQKINKKTTKPSLHAKCHLKDINLNVDYHKGGKWSIPSPKHRNENQLLSFQHSDIP